VLSLANGRTHRGQQRPSSVCGPPELDSPEDSRQWQQVGDVVLPLSSIDIGLAYRHALRPHPMLREGFRTSARRPPANRQLAKRSSGPLAMPDDTTC
jgi:hypothetical protein